MTERTSADEREIEARKLMAAKPTPSGPALRYSRMTLAARIDFVRAHTALTTVPFVPEVRLHTATELTPLWRATQEWLGTFGLEVPFWCVPWAGGQALARWVLDHPGEVRGKRVLDFGAGSGLVALACAYVGAASVRAVDIDPFAEAACLMNAEENGLSIDVSIGDIVGSAVEADVLLAGDVWYERAPAARFEAWLGASARQGVRVVTGDPARSYVPSGLLELARYDVPTTADLESATMRTTRVLTFSPHG